MTPRILIAGIGNIFLGDDAFGVVVARRLAEHPLPPGVEVRDFGIRGLDLAYALSGGCDAAILVDAMPRGGVPGTLYLIEPDAPEAIDAAGPALAAHSVDPMAVFALAQTLGGCPERLFVVGCEPGAVAPVPNDPDGLSPPVRAAVDEAVNMIESLLVRLHDGRPAVAPQGPA